LRSNTAPKARRKKVLTEGQVLTDGVRKVLTEGQVLTDGVRKVLTEGQVLTSYELKIPREPRFAIPSFVTAPF